MVDAGSENAMLKTGDVLFQKGRVRLILNTDGSLSGLVGGYRDWREVYGRDTFNVPSGGATRETYYHENQIAMYYALKRNADGIPDPRTGDNTAISAAFRFTAKPAFVVDPPVPIAVDQPPYPGGERAMTERKRFLLATTTRAIEPEVHGPSPDIPEQTADSARPSSAPQGRSGP
jgi:hypothetical protein